MLSPETIGPAPEGFTPSPQSLPTDPASIVFTSGSTGKPKGVTQSHRNLLEGCRTVAGYLGLREDDRIVCPIPWSFDYGLGQLLTTLICGITQILPRVANPFGLCEAIAAYRPTVLPGIPSWFTYLLRGVSPFRTTDVSSIRLVTNTGGRIPLPIARELPDAFPKARIVLNYGLTESYRTSYLDPDLVRERPDSVGKPMPGVDVVIVREDGSFAEAGELGEMVHRGNCICLGYWNDQAATAKALRADPLSPSGCPNPPRALFTGDLGYKDEDGFLYLVGRKDHQLKSMGVRVSPSEVEDILFQSGLVREVAVFGMANDLIGDEVVAAVVPADGVDDIKRQLDVHARRTMSQYMMPRHYFMRPELPKTHSGKVDYQRLKTEAAEGSSSLTKATPLRGSR